MHPRAPETDVPAAASSPVSHAARRRAAMPRTWPARVTAAGRWRLLTWPLLHGPRRSIPVITNPGVASRRPAPAEVFGVVGTLLSTSFDAGVPLRDVQEAASHADPSTTMRYDRARASLDRHATYIAGAAR